MSDITPLIATDRMVITSYAQDSFTISGKIYDHPIIITPTTIERWDCGQNIYDAIDCLMPMLVDTEILIFGTGKFMQRPNPKLRAILHTQINFDIMNTMAACHTYNITMSEGRRVIAAIVPVNFGLLETACF